MIFWTIPLTLFPQLFAPLPLLLFQHRSNTLLVDVRTLLYKPTPPPPPTPQSVPQIVPEHAPAPTNDPPTVSIHPMVTHSRVETTRPNPCYAGHVSTIFPLPRSYKEAFNDPNWRNAMFDEYNALIKNKTWTSVPRPEGANIRSLYGLKQAPRAWFQRFVAYITAVGFTPSHCDSSLFIYRQLLLYVDDIVLTASSDRLLQ
ncbi:ribonuclease H-like domain-containing protein [Tanacetum coccineum]